MLTYVSGERERKHTSIDIREFSDVATLDLGVEQDIDEAEWRKGRRVLSKGVKTPSSIKRREVERK